MSTRRTKSTRTESRGLSSGLRALKPLVLVALVPLAVACTNPLTPPVDTEGIEPVELRDEFNPEEETVEDFEERMREEHM